MDLGRELIGVDCVPADFDRMRQETLAKVRKAVADSEVDLLLAFRLEKHPIYNALGIHDRPKLYFGIASLAVFAQGTGISLHAGLLPC